MFLRLVATADVVVENFRPGTLERWGLGPDVLHEVNPGLVLARITGFGQTGPYAARAGFGTLAEAMSGFAHLTGAGRRPADAAGVRPRRLDLRHRRPRRRSRWRCSHRERNGGRGQVVDLSLLEPIMTAVGPGPTVYQQTGAVGTRHGNRSTNNAPRNTYRTSDGQWVAVSTSAQAIAERVMRLVGHPEVIDEPWFAAGATRAAARRPARRRASAAGSPSAPATRWSTAFTEAGAAVAPIYSARDLVEDPHVRATGMLTEVDDADLGPVLQHNVMWRMSRDARRDPLHRPRRSAPTPTPCSASSACPSRRDRRAARTRRSSDDDAMTSCSTLVAARASGSSTSAARCTVGHAAVAQPPGVLARAARAATATWSAPTAARPPTT